MLQIPFPKNQNYITGGNMKSQLKLQNPIIKYKTIFDREDAVEKEINNAPEKVNVLEKPLQFNKQPNPDMINTQAKKDAILGMSNKSIQDTISSNQSLKDKNYELYHMLNGNKYPDINEIRLESTRKPTELDNTLLGNPTLTTISEIREKKPQEVVSVRFEFPYEDDKAEFDKYIQSLISKGKKYKIMTNDDGSITISHTNDLTETIVKSKPQTRDDFLEKHNLYNQDTDKLTISSLASLNKEELLRGIKLFDVKTEGITSRKELRDELKKAIETYHFNNRLKIIQDFKGEDENRDDENLINMEDNPFPITVLPSDEKENEEPEFEDEDMKSIEIKPDYKLPEDITNNKNIVNWYRDNRNLNKNNLTILEKLKENLLNNQNKMEKNSFKHQLKQYNKEIDRLKRERGILVKDEKKKGGKLIKLPIQRNIKNRISIASGEIMSGNDNPKLKHMLKRDLVKATKEKVLPPTKIRELIKLVL